MLTGFSSLSNVSCTSATTIFLIRFKIPIITSPPYEYCVPIDLKYLSVFAFGNRCITLYQLPLFFFKLLYAQTIAATNASIGRTGNTPITRSTMPVHFLTIFPSGLTNHKPAEKNKSKR